MIAIVDYGVGNVCAFANVYKKLNLPYVVASDASALEQASHIVLPGVGSFDCAMLLLTDSGMRGVLDRLVLKQKVPVLGVCVGMQMMANSSDEGHQAGLGWIDGEVKRFNFSNSSTKTRIPHMGWNNILPKKEVSLFQNTIDGSRFYFLHSYYFRCASAENSIAETSYGETFTCAVGAGNIFGVQFHPEKSHGNGIQLLTDFATL